MFSLNSTRHVWQAFNALFIIRCLVKYIIETGSEYQLLQHFEAIPSPAALEEATAAAAASRSNSSNNGTIVSIDEPTTSSAAGTQTIFVDGSKFESFFDALVNLIVVIPVK